MTHSKIVAILNISPESFSDGNNALKQTYKSIGEQIEQSADIVDIGGQSTAPGALDIGIDEELFRIEGFLSTKTDQDSVYPFSIDTRHAQIAEYAIQQGAIMINDVSGGRHDREMYSVIANNPGVLYVCMYAQQSNGIAQPHKQEQDIVDTLSHFFDERIQQMKNAGIQNNQIILDPGMGGFISDDYNDSIRILQSIPLLKKRFPYPFYICTSRKGFLKHISPDTGPSDRLGSSLASTLYALYQGADYVRVHDVHQTRQARDTRSRLSVNRTQ